MKFYVRELSEERFSSMAEEWQLCLENSDADPLFLSWPWLYTWWETWSNVLGLDLLLLGVFDESESLIGLGPFYLRHLETPIGLRVKRLHMLGNAWRILPTVRSEYSSLIARKGLEHSIQAEIFSFLSSLTWDELIVCDITEKQLSQWKESVSLTLGNIDYVQRSIDQGVCVHTNRPFSDWQAGLGRNTRLKAFNRRRYLPGLGHVGVKRATSASQLTDFFSTLNEFHQQRWSKPAFDSLSLNFHRRFIARLPDSMEALCTMLYLDGICISVLYDIGTGKGRYNLQSGYRQNLDSKLSLGTLHLGFAIEDGFRTVDCAYYDLLAGSGKVTNYKAHFNGEDVNFTTVQLVRNPMLKMIYKVQSGLPQRFRKKINQYLKL